MAWAKTKTAIAVTGGVLLAAGSATVVLKAVSAPAGDVIDRLAHQSGQKIICEKRLHGPVTLDLKNLTLPEALDAFSVQAGAYWTVDYAVYGSDRTLQRLLQALQDGTELRDVGWTNLSSSARHANIVTETHMPGTRSSGGGFMMPKGVGPGSETVSMVVVLGPEASAKVFQGGDGMFSTIFGPINQAMKDGQADGWLHRATHFAAAQLLRTERRRKTREQEAIAMNSLQSESAPVWDQVGPLLDEALDRLDHADRNALLLRFFEQRSLAEIGTALGATEDAARKRVSRALEKVRADLIRRGVATTAAGLAAAISVNAVQVAPAGVAASLAAASLTGAVAVTGKTLTIFKLMTMTKLQAGIIGVVAVAGVATLLVIEHQTQGMLQGRDESLRQQGEQIAALLAENQRLSNLLAETNSPRLATDELLRLRAEVGRLRRNNADGLVVKQNAARQNSAKEGVVAASPRPEPFRSQVHTEIGFDQTMVTGGWATTPGRRMLVFVKPELGQTADGAQTITLRPTGIEVPEDLLAQHGLGSLASDSNQTLQHGQLLASTDASSLLNKLAAAPDAQQTKLGGVVTFPGHAAELQIAGSDGGRVSLTATPNLTQDGKGIELQLDAVLAPGTKQDQTDGR